MNIRCTPLALMLLMAGTSTIAHAQWKDFYIKGGIVSPQGDSRDMTQDTKGFTFEAGYIVKPTLWPGEVHFYLGYVKMGGNNKFKPWVKGAGPDGPFKMDYDKFQAMPASQQGDYSIYEQKFSYDMTGHVFGMDFVFPFEACSKKFSVFTGPSLHQWYMVKTNPQQAITERNLKAGWRLGGTYRHNDQVEFSVTYTATEWRSTDQEVFEMGANPSRPSYLSITAGYRF